MPLKGLNSYDAHANPERGEEDRCHDRHRRVAS